MKDLSVLKNSGFESKVADKTQADVDISFSILLAAHARSAEIVERPGDRVLSVQPRNTDIFALAGGERTAVARQPSADWSSAIELILEATEAIRISEDRAAHLEEQLAQVAGKATEQIRQLRAEIDARDKKIIENEERLRAAELRADNAETWLRKLHDAVHSSFSMLRRP